MAPSTRRIISPICVNSGSSPSATGSRCFVPPNGYNYKDLLKRLKIAGREINRALGQALPFLTLSPRSCTSLTIFTVIRRPGLHPPDLIEARLCQHSQYVSRNIKHNSHADPKQPPCHHPIQAFPSPVDTSRENINGLPTQEEGGVCLRLWSVPGVLQRLLPQLQLLRNDLHRSIGIQETRPHKNWTLPQDFPRRYRWQKRAQTA
jgi:hypothetical protein